MNPLPLSAVLAASLGAAALAQMASPAPPAPNANVPSQVTVKLAPQNNSNESGTATLTQTAKGLTVTLTLTPAPSAPQPAHIHKGTCANLDPAPKYPLQNVTASSTTSGAAAGASTTTLTNVTLDDLTKGTFAINVHKSTSDIKTYVACGDIKLANPSGTMQ